MSDAEQLILVGLYLRPDQRERLATLKRETGANQSYIVRQALDAYFAHADRQPPDMRPALPVEMAA